MGAANGGEPTATPGSAPVSDGQRDAPDSNDNRAEPVLVASFSETFQDGRTEQRGPWRPAQRRYRTRPVEICGRDGGRRPGRGGLYGIQRRGGSQAGGACAAAARALRALPEGRGRQ